QRRSHSAPCSPWPCHAVSVLLLYVSIRADDPNPRSESSSGSGEPLTGTPPLSRSAAGTPGYEPPRRNTPTATVNQDARAGFGRFFNHQGTTAAAVLAPELPVRGYRPNRALIL